MQNMSRAFREWSYPCIFTLLIYATLPVGPKAVLFLDRQLLSGNLSLTLVLVSIGLGISLLVSTWIRFRTNRPSRYFWLLVIFFIACLAILIPGTPAERIHSLEYAILSILWWRAVKRLSLQRDQVYLAVLLITVSLGVVDELIQYLLPNRWFGLDDILRNASGGVIGVMYLALVERK